MNNPLFSLDGKVSVVTGAANGMGQAIACALSDAGSKVVGVDYVSCGKTAAIIGQDGKQFKSLCFDLLKTEQIPEIVEQAMRWYGQVDVLVNCAGTIRRRDAIDFTDADWDDVLTLNLKSVFKLCQAAAKVFIPQKSGKIINIGSLLSFQGGIRVVSYTASKSGVAGITKAMANEWAPFGIQVNAIAPGYIATDLTTDLMNDTARSQAILARIPAGRWGNATDVAGTAVFLASSASDYIQGTVIPVDGGWLAR